jgi:DNA-binding transcriptional ArsR family regulator
MRDVLVIDAAERAGALLHPLRIEVLKQLAEPRSCPEIAKALGETPQKIYYHVKTLESAELVERVEERRVRGIMEGIYRARAKSYWLSPALVGKLGGPARARGETSLGFLLNLAEEIQADVGRLGEKTVEGESVPTLGLSMAIDLPSGVERSRFLADVRKAFQELASKYAAKEAEAGEAYRVSLLCYPKESPQPERSAPQARERGASAQ